MAHEIGPEADHVRVLSDLSGQIVGALVDETEEAPKDDAFAVAARRYRAEGAPEPPAAWRRFLRTATVGGHAIQVLKRLTRDLLERAYVSPDEVEADRTEVAAETPPPNVRAIGDAREVPALELASDGTWRPSGSLSSQDELDAGTRRRVNIPSLTSRYPDVAPSGGFVLPPPPPQK